MMIEWVRRDAEGKMRLCADTGDLEKCFTELKLGLQRKRDEQLTAMKKELEKFMEGCELQMFVVQWKEQKINALQEASERTHEKAFKLLKKKGQQRKLQIYQEQKDAKLEAEILEEARNLAQTLQGGDRSVHELEKALKNASLS